MGGDVAPAPALGVLRRSARADALAAATRSGASRARSRSRPAGVARRQPDHRDQVGRVPQAVGRRPRPARGCRAAASRHAAGSGSWTVAAGGPEPNDAALVALDDDQAADR